MAKAIKPIGVNVVAIEKSGAIHPINFNVYKDEKAVVTAYENGELPINEGFAGYSMLPVFTFEDVKEITKPRPVNPAALKGGKDKTPTPPPVAPVGEGTNPKG